MSSTGSSPSPSHSPSSRAPSPSSFPPIEERVEEEERAAEEAARCPPSPLAHFYSSLTLSDRYAWPPFLGDWAFEEGQPRRVSTGCMEEEGDSEVRSHVEETYAKDDMAVHPHHPLPPPSFLLDLHHHHHHHVTVRKRNSVCDIEFHFPLLPSPSSSSPSSSSADPTASRLQRPRDLPISPIAVATPSASALTSQSSVADWEVVARRHSYVHVRDTEWVFFIVLFVFVSLWLELSIHNFVLILVALQAMYFLLLSLV
ncbi:uncharacterized protein LOC143291026 [Babylonia areolata]|uniref:uncharacterized protein LOC143291026 n=1 Tax=Babylonia areolata TaxID=304850 RepID=UPI003FD35FBF